MGSLLIALGVVAVALIGVGVWGFRRIARRETESVDLQAARDAM